MIRPRRRFREARAIHNIKYAAKPLNLGFSPDTEQNATGQLWKKEEEKKREFSADNKQTLHFSNERLHQEKHILPAVIFTTTVHLTSIVRAIWTGKNSDLYKVQGTRYK